MFSKSQIPSPSVSEPSVKELQGSIARLPRLSSEDDQEVHDMLHMLGRLQQALESKLGKHNPPSPTVEVELKAEEVANISTRTSEALMNQVECKVEAIQQPPVKKHLFADYLKYPRCPSCQSFAVKKVRRSLLQKLSHPQESFHYCSSCKESFRLPL